MPEGDYLKLKYSYDEVLSTSESSILFISTKQRKSKAKRLKILFNLIIPFSLLRNRDTQ
jgi:hypothetical protein